MTTMIRYRGRTSIAISLIAALALAVPMQRARADSILTPLVLPPSTQPYGMTYGQWSAAWWQYVGSIPVPKNPVLDQTAADCGVGQSGPVWFLVGVFGGTATRTCTVPAGKALFFPIINGGDCGDTLGLMRKPISILHSATNLSATVDGTSIPGLSTPMTTYRTLSPVFTLVLPDNNIFTGAAGSLGPCVSDGIYLMLAPLPAGQHTIQFSASQPGFSLDVTYHLTVLSS